MRFIAFTAAVVTSLALWTAGLGGSHTAQAAPVAFDLHPVGSQEVPAAKGQGGAVVHLTWDATTRIMTYSVTVTGLSPDQVIGAHFHRGARGVAGPVIYPLSLVGFTQISGSVTFAAGDVADLQAGNFYFNVHSTTDPAGFSRDQIILPAAAAAPAAPVALPATGTGRTTSGTSTDLIVLAGLLAITIGGAGVLAFRRA